MLKGPEIGVAFVGAGIVAEMHGRGVAATPGSQLVGVYDPAISRAKKITEKFGGRPFKSLEQLLADERVDAVHVLSPAPLHVPIALDALKAGKHVLVEKPVAMNVEEIQRLQIEARKRRRVCMPAHNYIYAPSLIRAQRLIADKKLGQVAALWILYNILHSEKILAQYGPDALQTICIHHAYSLLFLLGRPTRVSAVMSTVGRRKLEIKDQISITCEMPDGAMAHLWCSLAINDPTSDPWTVLYKVLGTKGGLTYSWNEAQFEDHGGPAWGLPCYEDGFRGEIDFFINHAIRKGQEPLSTLDDAISALEIIQAAEQSARSGKRQTVKYTQPA
jgi:predicted dehydrogenase